MRLRSPSPNFQGGKLPTITSAYALLPFSTGSNTATTLIDTRRNWTTNEWAGKSTDGNPLPDGTYFYVLKLNNTRYPGIADVFKGAVLIKR